MKYEIVTTDNFEKKAKSLPKKFKSLKQELALLAQNLLKNPVLGVPLGNNCYKIRIAIKSIGKGKRGGARVITFLELDFNVILEEETTNIFLLTIYDKSDTDSVTEKELEWLIKRRNE